jgi:hypothetical protein
MHDARYAMRGTFQFLRHASRIAHPASLILNKDFGEIQCFPNHADSS